MKTLKNKILEGLKINSKSKINYVYFTDEELRNDYEEVSMAYTKAEKQKFANKYGIQSNKILEIQQRIVEILRDNRQEKKKFDMEDFKDFIRLNLPEKYDKLKEYFDKEPKEFLDFYYEYYNKQTNSCRRLPSYNISSKQRYLIKRYNQIKKYLEEEYDEKF